MVKLRLARVGAKKKPFYRLVATDSRNARDGRFIEILGSYSPNTTPEMTGLKEERVFYWLDNGAQMSDTVHTLFKGQGVLMRWRMRNEPSVPEEEEVPVEQEEAEEEVEEMDTAAEEEAAEHTVEAEALEGGGEVTQG